MWRVIDLADFVKKLPRYRPTIGYEINEAGEIRKFYPNAKVPRYFPVQTEVRQGKECFTCVAGAIACASVRATIPVAQILEKYFPAGRYEMKA